MADYPMTPATASTLASSDPAPDPRIIAHLLATLDAIPRSELPDGEDRDLLAALIRWGAVDNLYTPIGHTNHLIAWAYMPPWRDSRQSLADWRAHGRWWELGSATAGEVADE